MYDPNDLLAQQDPTQSGAEQAGETGDQQTAAVAEKEKVKAQKKAVAALQAGQGVEGGAHPGPATTPTNGPTSAAAITIKAAPDTPSTPAPGPGGNQ